MSICKKTGFHVGSLYMFIPPNPSYMVNYLKSRK